MLFRSKVLFFSLPSPSLPPTQTETGPVEEKPSKYVVRPPRDLSSQFVRRQAAKQQAEEERKRREAEEAQAAVSEQSSPEPLLMSSCPQATEEPAPDRYHGLRLHCWVLVLSGKREIAQSFFIEPTTGEWREAPGSWPLTLPLPPLPCRREPPVGL